MIRGRTGARPWIGPRVIVAAQPVEWFGKRGTLPRHPTTDSRAHLQFALAATSARRACAYSDLPLRGLRGARHRGQRRVTVMRFARITDSRDRTSRERVVSERTSREQRSETMSSRYWRRVLEAFLGTACLVSLAHAGAAEIQPDQSSSHAQETLPTDSPQVWRRRWKSRTLNLAWTSAPSGLRCRWVATPSNTSRQASITSSSTPSRR